MATSGLDTTSVEWKVVRENLVQLHCEDVSWEQATDKIPLDLVRYLLGDLVPHLSTLVFLRGNRCLFTIDWTNIPNSYAVWQYMVDNSFHKRTAMQVAHYHFTLMLSHVGPKSFTIIYFITYRKLYTLNTYAKMFTVEDSIFPNTWIQFSNPELLPDCYRLHSTYILQNTGSFITKPNRCESH